MAQKYSGKLVGCGVLSFQAERRENLNLLWKAAESETQLGMSLSFKAHHNTAFWCSDKLL